MGTDENGFMLVPMPYSLKLKKTTTTFLSIMVWIMCIRKPHLVTRVFTNALSKIFGLKFEGNKFETSNSFARNGKKLISYKRPETSQTSISSINCSTLKTSKYHEGKDIIGFNNI